MARGEPTRLANRVAAVWLLGHDMPSQPRFHLPVGLVSMLEVGDLVEALEGQVYLVTKVGPGALLLESAQDSQMFTNNGYGSYAWAFFAAPKLHWVLNR